jgi:hypothetical protein
MNFLTFNNTAKKLNATLFGMNGINVLPIAVDGEGNLLLSSEGAVTVTASNLDIRDLNYATDSVTVTATDLDIRNLTGTLDSVAVARMGFAELSASGTVGTSTVYALVTDISGYSGNSFYVKNLSGSAITVTVQISPIDDTSYYTTSSSQSVTTSTPGVAAVTIPIKYARLALVSSGSATYIAYYNGRA